MTGDKTKVSENNSQLKIELILPFKPLLDLLSDMLVYPFRCIQSVLKIWMKCKLVNNVFSMSLSTKSELPSAIIHHAWFKDPSQAKGQETKFR